LARIIRALGRGPVDALGGVLEDVPVATLGLAQRLLGLDELAHLDNRPDVPVQALGAPAHLGDGLAHPERGAVAPPQLGDEIDDPPAGAHRAQQLGPPVGGDIDLDADVVDFREHARHRAEAEHPRERGIGSHEAAFRRGLEDSCAGVFEQRAVDRIVAHAPSIRPRRWRRRAAIRAIMDSQR
jgi:hypothetical protein